MNLKYIVLAKDVKLPSGDRVTYYYAVLFNENMTHASVAEALEANFGKPVGAGFWDYRRRECYGESISLNIKSRGTRDSQIVGSSIMFCIEHH